MTNFNLSVGLTDRFVEAVRRGRRYALVNPRTGTSVRRLPASLVFDRLVEAAQRAEQIGAHEQACRRQGEHVAHRRQRGQRPLLEPQLGRALGLGRGPRGDPQREHHEDDLEPERWGQEQMRAEAVARTPLRRLGKSVDVARSVIFLASEDARYITGETLFIDGGRLASV